MSLEQPNFREIRIVKNQQSPFWYIELDADQITGFTNLLKYLDSWKSNPNRIIKLLDKISGLRGLKQDAILKAIDISMNARRKYIDFDTLLWQICRLSSSGFPLSIESKEIKILASAIITLALYGLNECAEDFKKIKVETWTNENLKYGIKILANSGRVAARLPYLTAFEDIGVQFSKGNSYLFSSKITKSFISISDQFVKFIEDGGVNKNIKEATKTMTAFDIRNPPSYTNYMKTNELVITQYPPKSEMNFEQFKKGKFFKMLNSLVNDYRDNVKQAHVRVRNRMFKWIVATTVGPNSDPSKISNLGYMYTNYFPANERQYFITHPPQTSYGYTMREKFKQVRRLRESVASKKTQYSSSTNNPTDFVG